MNIFIYGDGGVPTGFSTVLTEVIKALPPECNVYHLAINYKGDPVTIDTKCKYLLYPAGSKGDFLGRNRIQEFANKNIDVIFALNDIWVLDQFLDILKHHWKKPIPPVVVYFPVDATGFAKEWFDNFDVVTIPVVYTEFGRTVCKEVKPELDFEIVPHGTNFNHFYKIDKNEAKAKKYSKYPELWDSFIVLNVNRNQPRKRLDVALKGFSLFAQDKPKNVLYYHHAGLKDVGWYIPILVQRYGLQDRIIFSNTEQFLQNVSLEDLNLIYNATDVGLNTCYTPGTKILTKDGYKNIENISTDDVVFSHKGIAREVKNIFKFEKTNEEVLKITPHGILPFTITKNHKLFSVLSPYLKLARKYKKELLDNINPDFIESNLLMEGSLLTFPIIKDELVSIGEKKAFIYGAFVSEGSVRKDGIVFSLDSRIYDDVLRNKIISYMKDVYDLEPHIYNMDRNRQAINFFSRELALDFESKFDRGAHNKKIPNELLFMTRNEKVSFLEGAILGDGYLDKNTITYTTVSETLGWQIWFILTTLGNTAPSITQRSRGEFCIKVYGSGAVSLAKECNILFKSKKLNKPNKQTRPKIFIKDNYIYYPIRKVEKTTYSGDVYDLEVDVDHSYISHVAGHNSQGEGWGLGNTEHAVTGAPQIVPDHSACRELFSDCGLLIPTFMDFTYEQTMTVGRVVTPEAVAEKLNEIYYEEGLVENLGYKCMSKFTKPEYSWENVSKRFYETFIRACQLHSLKQQP